jgi:hypothetical protein
MLLKKETEGPCIVTNSAARAGCRVTLPWSEKIPSRITKLYQFLTLLSAVALIASAQTLG